MELFDIMCFVLKGSLWLLWWEVSIKTCQDIVIPRTRVTAVEVTRRGQIPAIF